MRSWHIRDVYLRATRSAPCGVRPPLYPRTPAEEPGADRRRRWRIPGVTRRAPSLADRRKSGSRPAGAITDDSAKCVVPEVPAFPSSRQQSRPPRQGNQPCSLKGAAWLLLKKSPISALQRPGHLDKTSHLNSPVSRRPSAKPACHEIRKPADGMRWKESTAADEGIQAG